MFEIAIEKLVRLYSYYRIAELRGAQFLKHLIRIEKNPKIRQKLAEQLKDESRHAELWNKLIESLGFKPVEVKDGYQVRVREEGGFPASLPAHYAHIIALEEIARERYEAHTRWPIGDEVRKILTTILGDEGEHFWMWEWLIELVGSEDAANAFLERYRKTHRKVMDGLIRMEREEIGFSFSDPPPRERGP